MDFDDYQDAAAGTDQFAGKKASKDEGLMIPLLGIAGETGTLLAEFKKKIRDKESYQGFKDKAEEELGGCSLVSGKHCHPTGFVTI